MRYIFLSIFFLLTLGIQAQNGQKPKIAIVGIGGEISTFSPDITTYEDFPILRGQELMDSYPFFRPDSSLTDKAEWVPILNGYASTGGTIEFKAYEKIVHEAIRKLKENAPYDGILFDIHGAMIVQGMDDPEGDFISRIREALGTEVLISTTMDLHGSVPRRLARNTDLITAFRKAPHDDRFETKKRALVNLLDRIEKKKGKPKYKAWIPVPILLPGEQTSTRVEPAKSLYAMIPELIHGDKVIDIAIWMSYPWADKPDNHAVVMAYGDDKNAVQKAAEKIAKTFWEVRNQFDFVNETVSFEEAVERALKSDKKPFIISDMGDNPGAGGSGDITWTLHELLQIPIFTDPDGKSWIYGGLKAPEFVEKAVEIGVGNEIDARAGAEIDDRYAGPVQIKGKIVKIRKGDKDTQVVVNIGNGYVVLSSGRFTFHYKKQFENLDLDPENSDILIVKQGYLVKELYDMRGDWLMALTPGGVDQDLKRLDYHRIRRPMYPLNDFKKEPNLEARFIHLADEIKR